MLCMTHFFNKRFAGFVPPSLPSKSLIEACSKHHANPGLVSVIIMTIFFQKNYLF